MPPGGMTLGPPLVPHWQDHSADKDLRDGKQSLRQGNSNFGLWNSDCAGRGSIIGTRPEDLGFRNPRSEIRNREWAAAAEAKGGREMPRKNRLPARIKIACMPDRPPGNLAGRGRPALRQESSCRGRSGSASGNHPWSGECRSGILFRPRNRVARVRRETCRDAKTNRSTSWSSSPTLPRIGSLRWFPSLRERPPDVRQLPRCKHLVSGDVIPTFYWQPVAANCVTYE